MHYSHIKFWKELKKYLAQKGITRDHKPKDALFFDTTFGGRRNLNNGIHHVYIQNIIEKHAFSEVAKSTVTVCLCIKRHLYKDFPHSPVSIPEDISKAFSKPLRWIDLRSIVRLGISREFNLHTQEGRQQALEWMTQQNHIFLQLRNPIKSFVYSQNQNISPT